jgi:hypothetical protein
LTTDNILYYIFWLHFLINIFSCVAVKKCDILFSLQGGCTEVNLFQQRKGGKK